MRHPNVICRKSASVVLTVVGDTRFDRVLQIREEAKELPLVEKFKGNNSFTFVAGSSWGPDEDLFLEYFN